MSAVNYSKYAMIKIKKFLLFADSWNIKNEK